MIPLNCHAVRLESTRSRCYGRLSYFLRLFETMLFARYLTMIGERAALLRQPSEFRGVHGSLEATRPNNGSRPPLGWSPHARVLQRQEKSAWCTHRGRALAVFFFSFLEMLV